MIMRMHGSAIRSVRSQC